MNGFRLTDAELGRLLRAHLPAPAPGLRDAIVADVMTTRQQRRVWAPISALFDADPTARRRALLLAAALLLAMSAVVAGAIGTILDRRTPEPFRDLTLEPPPDLPAFVRTAYSSMSQLPPMTITTIEDGSIAGRIYVDRSGAVRIEELESPPATEPRAYEVLSGTSIGELLIVDSQPAWHEQQDAIGEDPRVFVFARLGGARYGTGTEYGCEIGTSPGESYSYPPGNAWRYVGIETVAGRRAHHVTCADTGDLWIDVETRLTLRSQGLRRGTGGFPVPGELHTIEVTSIELGQPSSALFEIRRPDGVRALSQAEYDQHQCVRFGWCLASPRPPITPPPVPGEQPVANLPNLVRLAQEAPLALGPYAITVEERTTGSSDEGARSLLFFDGTSRYRIERTSQLGTVWEATMVTLGGDDYRYTSEILIDGTLVWRASTRGGAGYPMQVPVNCAGDWEHRGVDQIAGRAADHISCASDATTDYWIDRATHLVTRIQTSGDPMQGTIVQEVVALRLGETPIVEWDLPEGANVQP
jgi:hypothetical protein